MSESDLKESQPGQPPDSPVDQLPTHKAAANNDIAMLSDLVQEGAPLLGPDTRETPLHAAAKRGAMDTLRWLLDNKTVSPVEKAVNGNTAAHYTAVYGHLEALKLLVEHDPELSQEVVSQVDESGLSLISLATLQGDEEMTGWLVDNYPDVGLIPNMNGDLAVHFAAAQGHLGILKILVRQYGKEILEKQDKNSTKPVYFASQEGRLTVLDYLINELGIDPVAREKSGISSVHAAVQAGRYKAVKWLIGKLGPKYILDKTIDGATPLHMAAAQGHTDILRYLLEHVENKNDVNVLDHIHATPAHDAAEYGQMESMLLLLKNGADISVKDTENKTPYDLAVEQSHTKVAAMIADLRDNGPMVLAKYEKKRKRSVSQPASMMQPPHTTRQEAEELSAAIKQSSTIQEQRRNQELQREESLQRMNERGLEVDPRPLGMSDEDDIEHTLGPNGDIYAKPKKKRHRRGRHKSGEDLHNDPTYAAVKPKNTLLDTMLPLEDPAYASATNHETTSNYSRPSRVRRYRDSDSEITSVSSRYQDGRHNIPGLYPPYGHGGGGGGGGGYRHLPLPHPFRRPPHSSASSVRSSKTGHSRRQGYPNPMMSYSPYGYYPMPYPSYGYPYPHYGQNQPPAATAPGHMMYYYYPPQRGRRQKLRKKKLRSRQPSRNPSPPGGTPRKHTDADMGYGPAVARNRDESSSVVGRAKTKKGKGAGSDNQSGLHPPAPPITVTDTNAAPPPGGGGDAVVNFDSNFIMMKKSNTTDGIQQLGGTTLNTANPPKHYDGRWDEYIMTDSEPEREVDENHCVAFAAETVAILAIGCVSGLKGLRRMKKGIDEPDRPYLSSAWDEPPMPPTKNRSRNHSRRDSLTGLADPSLRDVTPEDFAAREEMGQGEGWAGAEAKKSKKKKNKKGGKKEEIEMKYLSASAEVLDKQPQSELLAGEMEKQRNASVSRNFGGKKMLFHALGARESSMLDIASSSLAGSQNPSADEEEDDEFDETINMVHGIRSGDRRKNSAKKSDGSSTPERGLEGGERPRSGRKDKQRAKEEERVRKEREKEEKKKEKMNAKREKQRKKEEEKRARQETKERTRESSTPTKRPLTPRKKKSSSPPTPLRAAPPPPPKSTTSTVSSRGVPPTKKKLTYSASGGRDSGGQPQGHLSPSPPLQPRRADPPSSASSQQSRKMETKKPVTSSTPLVREENQTSQRRQRGEKAPLMRSSPTQPRRSTAPYKQPSREIGREAKKTTVSVLQAKPPLGRITSDGAKQRKNRYFEGESEEEEESVTSTPKWMGKQPAQRPKPTSVEKEMETDIADLDAVLAELEGIQTGDLTTWLEPNKVTDIDEAESSEDSLPLVVPTATKRPASKRPSPPRSQAFGSSPQTKPVGTSLRPDTEDTPTFSPTENNYLSRPQREEEEGWFPGRQHEPLETPVPDASSLQRTKHGSPHPGRRQRGHSKEEVDSVPAAPVGFEDTDGGGSSGHRSSFEQRVMSTLEALKESMNQLQRNPSITQTEITEQTQLQQQLVQNLVTYSQHDPQLVNRLIPLLSPDKDGLESSSTDQLEQLQQKILGAHEKTYQETQEHFRNQEALQRAIQRSLEEQAQQHQKGMEANFQMFSKMMQEQLSEQQKKFEEEYNRRKREKEEEEAEEQGAKEKRKKKKSKDRSKKKKKHRRRSDSESESSHSEDEGTVMVSGQTADIPAVKTMEAKIYTQDLLQDTNPPPKQAKGRVRRTSDVEFLRTTEALSKNFPLGESEPPEDEDDEEMYFQHARPVTIRRADIKVQRQDEYTARRPSNDGVEFLGYQTRQIPADEKHFEDFHILKTRPPKQLKEPEKPPDFDEKDLRYGKQHVELNERRKREEELNPLSGAGGELAAALRLRQKQISNKKT